MSKNIFKQIFAVAIALLVLSAQIDMPVSAFTGTNETNEETSSANQEQSAADSVEATPASGAATENETPAIVDYSADTTSARGLLKAETKPFAIFDGQDLSAADNGVTYQNYTSTVNSKTLEINTPITDSASITSHKLVIRIENGLAIESGPGLKPVSGYNGNTVNWTFDSSKNYLADDLQGKIIGLSWTPDPVIKGFYQPASGTLTYDIAPGTTAVNFSIAIKSDVGFNLTDNQITYANPITIQKLENDAVVKEEKLENYTISGTYRPTVYSHGSTQIMYVKPGQLVEMSTFIDQAGESVPVNQVKDVLYEEITYTWKIDKNAGIQGIKPNGRYNTSNMIVTIDRTSDAQYDLLTMTLDKAPIGNQNFSFQFQPPADATDGTYSVLLVNSKTKLYGHSDYVTYPNFAAYPADQAGQPTVVVSSSTESDVRLSDLRGSKTFAYNQTQASGSIVPLGGFSIANSSPNDSVAQNLQMKFDDPSYGVQAVRIAFGAEATNIVVHTNKGQTFTPDKMTGTYGPARKIRMADIVLADLGSVADDEYITEITYTANSIPAGTNSSNGMEGSTNQIVGSYPLALEYFGILLNRPVTNTFSATATIVDSDKAFTDASAQHVTNVMNVADAAYMTFSTAESFSGSVKSSGTIVPLHMEFNRADYSYTGNTAAVVTGFDIYLREGDYMTIDQSSIKVSWGSEVYTLGSPGLTITPTTDNTGKQVYKLSLPEVSLGAFGSGLVRYPKILVDYNAKIKPTAPTTSIPGKDLAQIMPMNGIGVVPVGGNGGNNQYNNANIFNVDGSGNTTKAVGTPPSTTTLKIQAQKSFTVTSAANLNGGPWVSYDYDTQKEIINLNPAGKAQYQLTVTNNSGQTIDGYTALVPIPKAGEATDLMPDTPANFVPGMHLQKSPFEWTVSLLEAVDTSENLLNYQVTYSKTYETNKDSSAFVSWDAIVDKNDIRMVKITTTDSISDGTNDVIAFPLALTDPNAEENAGKTNIYSARIHRVIGDSAGYNPSEPVAIRLKTGVVSGTVFNDLNRNGVRDAGEPGRNGVTVQAYAAGTTTLIDTVISQQKNGVDGVYEFMGLDKNQPVDIVFTNPNTDDSTRFSPVASGGSTPTEAADHKLAKTSGITPSSAAGIVVDAGIITPTVVTFNAQGGSTAETTVKRYPGEKITTKPEATKTGYTFNDWFPTATGGTAVTFPYTVGTADTTLYAQYTANQYTLSFDVATNGGEGTAPADQVVTYGNKAAEPATPAKTGYSFSGWYDAATGGNKWEFDTTTMPAGNTTLYAQFIVNSYTVTFDNEGVTTTATVPYAAKVTEPSAPLRTGYTFDGWYTAVSGGTKWNFTTGTMPANDLTLYAQYTVNSYLITYNNQGTITTELLPYNSYLTEPSAPAKSGYSFTGWYDAASGGNKWNFATNTVPATNITLYAQFSADDQTITFDVNGGNAASKPLDVVQPTDSNVNLDAVAIPTKAGYTFIGWFDASDVPYSGTITMPVGGLQLVAHWTAADQVIRFTTNGGTGVPAITAATDTTVDLDTVSTTRAGYQFDGWYVGNVQYSSVITVPAGGLTLEAHWIALDQTITFDTDGAGTIASITAPTDSTIDLSTITAPSKYAYKFLGWFDALGVEYSGTIAMPAGGLQLQAHWQDLIATGVWSIKANNIEFSMSELNQFINAGTLEQEILNRSNAEAWDGDRNAELTPLRADTTVLLANATAGDYLVEVSHDASAANGTTFATTNAEQGLTTTITVRVTDDTTPSLPVTGQNLMAGGLIGGLMTIAAAVMLILNKRRKNN